MRLVRKIAVALTLALFGCGAAHGPRQVPNVYTEAVAPPNYGFEREAAAPLPEGFVYLSVVAPDILQDMRYARSENFMGRPIAGYQDPQCILTLPAAEALIKAQASAVARNLQLVVFDCYRPARAVADFMAWTRTPGPADPVWRPQVAKDRLVAEGYIAERSGHSRGSTLDLGLTLLAPTPPVLMLRASPCRRMDLNTLFFGTPFDCFDPASATAFPNISQEARTNRDALLSIMTQAGFRNYSAEWWHYTLNNEPHPNEFFDFPVTNPK